MKNIHIENNGNIGDKQLFCPNIASRQVFNEIIFKKKSMYEKKKSSFFW